MNDPFEGEMSSVIPVDASDSERIVVIEKFSRLRALVDGIRFACFCTTATNPLLWAHYASGYRGIAFEYEIAEEAATIDLLPVQYSPAPQITYETCLAILSGDQRAYEQGLLLTKRDEWAYESEYRLFLKADSGSYLEEAAPIAVILAGKDMPYRSPFEALCKKLNIPLGYLITDASGYHVLYPDGRPTGVSYTD